MGLIANLTVRTPSAQSASAQSPADTPRSSFTEFLAGIRSDAISRGVRSEVVDAALANIDEPLPVIIESDRTQAEVRTPLERYVARRLTPRTINTAREMRAENQTLLAEIAARYGVAPQVIVSIWGIESNFGRVTGKQPTIPALATLAWDPRRSTLFRAELIDALEILNRGDVDLAHMRGSWAGAMGQVQFLPSSYLQFAEDFDRDGRRDIWSTPADVFASIANYLKGHGWTENMIWGREVKVPPGAARKIAGLEGGSSGCHAMREMPLLRPAAEWEKIGVRSLSGGPLPRTLPETSIVSGASRHFLVSRNYGVLLEYNCAHTYAVSVGLLSDRIARAER